MREYLRVLHYITKHVHANGVAFEKVMWCLVTGSKSIEEHGGVPP